MDYPSLADIAAVTDKNRTVDDGMFGGSWGMILILFLILTMGGGNWNGRGNAVTEADLCNANSFSELKAGVARNNDAINNMYTGLQNGLSNFGYETLRNFNAVQAQLAECCCTTQRAIDSVNYNGAISTPATSFRPRSGALRRSWMPSAAIAWPICRTRSISCSCRLLCAV